MRKAIFATIIVLATTAGVSAARPQVREVPFPYPTIQDAIDDAADGDTVVVHPGTYSGTGNRGIDFKGKAITVRSEDPEEAGIVAATIIDCMGTPADPNRAFIFHTLEDANSIVDGFTIINGYMVASAGPADANGNPGKGGDSLGGAIACIGTSPIIRNCIINNCVAEGGAGGAGTPGTPGIPADPGDPNDPNDDIPGTPPGPGGPGGDGGSGYGGGIYCDPNSGPIILDCEFNSCSALQGAGGAGGAGGASGDPNDPNATGGDGEAGISDANGWGGGIFVASGSTAVISDCVFYDCNAIGGSGADDALGLGAGGAIFFGTGYSGTLVADISACDSGGGYGGGVYCENDCNLVISGCPITECSGRYGAGIYCSAASILEVSDSNVANGTAEYGGGLCFAPGCTVTVIGTNISGNTADYDGGGIFFPSEGSLTLSGCDIMDNLAADGTGGGIYFDTNGTLKLATCRITNNSCGENFGGGIRAGSLGTPLGAKVEAVNCIISDNTALYGGGMCLLETTAQFNHCTISDNEAEYGGGAYLYLSDVNIADSTISNNTAATRTYCSGGGLYCLNSTERLEHCVIEGNQAQGFGGGVYIVGPNLPGGAQEMTNCLVTGNSAGLDGAGISLNVDAVPVLSNCTIADNFTLDAAGSGGGLSCYDAFAEITDSILYGNTAGYGPEIAVGDPFELVNPPAGVTVTYSDVWRGESYIHVSTGCTLNWDPNNNIGANPLFTNGYFLSNTEAGDNLDSPCIDAGSDTAEAKELHRRTTRVDSAPDKETVDMGYHYRMQGILCDCDFDGNIDISDMAIMFSYWLDGSCDLSYDCEGADADLDHDVDLFDLAICASIYAPVDEAPPTPNPSEWEMEPQARPEIPNAVAMRAALSTDENGVEYRFVCTSGGGHDSGWQAGALYIDRNLPPGAYTYKCQARDKSPQQNATAWSTEVTAFVGFN